MTRYLEDYRIGETDEYGSYTVTEEEILEFAERYDPQYFHTDPDAAEESAYGRLIASGWHTACIAMRLAVLHGYLRDAAVIAGIGVEELTWSHPVYPGDTLRVKEKILDRRPSESAPDQGILTIEIRVFNQENTEVLSMDWIDVVRRREDS